MKYRSVILWLWSKFLISWESDPNRSFRLRSLLEVKQKEMHVEFSFAQVQNKRVGLSIPKIMAMSKKHENVV